VDAVICYCSFACLCTVYVDHLHRKHNCVILVHGLEIPSLPTRECTSAHRVFYLVQPCTWPSEGTHCRGGGGEGGTLPVGIIQLLHQPVDETFIPGSVQ